AEIRGRLGYPPRRIKRALAGHAADEIAIGVELADIAEVSAVHFVIAAALFGKGDENIAPNVLNAERSEAGRKGGIGEIPRKADLSECRIIDVHAAILEVGGIEVIGRTVIADGKPLVDGPYGRGGGRCACAAGPRGDFAVFSGKDEPCAAESSSGAVRVVHDPGRGGIGAGNGYDQRLFDTGSVVERGFRHTIVGNPPWAGCGVHDAPWVDEVRIGQRGQTRDVGYQLVFDVDRVGRSGRRVEKGTYGDR